jgi:hypothetical protein
LLHSCLRSVASALVHPHRYVASSATSGVHAPPIRARWRQIQAPPPAHQFHSLDGERGPGDSAPTHPLRQPVGKCDRHVPPPCSKRSARGRSKRPTNVPNAGCNRLWYWPSVDFTERASERADGAPALLLQSVASEGPGRLPNSAAARMLRPSLVVARSLSGRRRSTSRRKTVRCSSTWQSQFVLAGGDARGVGVKGWPNRRKGLDARQREATPPTASLRHPRSIESPAPVPILLIQQFAESRRRKSHSPTGAFPVPRRDALRWGHSVVLDRVPCSNGSFWRAEGRIARGTFFLPRGRVPGKRSISVVTLRPSHDARRDDAPPLLVAWKDQGASKAKNPVCCSAVLSRESVLTLLRTTASPSRYTERRTAAAASRLIERACPLLGTDGPPPWVKPTRGISMERVPPVKRDDVEDRWETADITGPWSTRQTTSRIVVPEGKS